MTTILGRAADQEKGNQGAHASPFKEGVQLSSVQSLSRVRLLAAPWTAARQASLSITNSWSAHGHHQMVNTEIRLIIFFAAKDGEALYSQQKQDWGDCGSDHELLIAKFRLKSKKVGKTLDHSGMT